MINDAQEHFRWIGITADRIINAKNTETELPLLSLSFLDDNHNLTFYSNQPRPNFPITIEDLSNAKLYGIIVSTILSNKKAIGNNYDFDMILNDLSNEGYIPQKPCDVSGLKSGNIEHHINLCRSIEFFVIDKSLNIEILESDLRRLPRSFFVLKSNEQIDLLEDAISLWLSKFHCNVQFSEELKHINDDYKNNAYNLSEKNYNIQIDTSNFAKVAACLARIFPKQINKNEIKKGDNQEEIENNKKLSKIILDELHAYTVEKFPTDEKLFMLFISDLFYATRSGSRKFVKLDHNIQLQKIHSMPQPRILSKENGLVRVQASSSLVMKTSSLLTQKVDTKVAQSPAIIKQTPKTQQSTPRKPKVVKPVVEQKQQKKEKEKSPKKIEKKVQKEKNNKEKHLVAKKNQKETPKEEKHKLDQIDNHDEIIAKDDSKESIEEPKSQENIENDDKSNENESKKPIVRKYILEFPEIEIILKKLKEKYPQNENDYDNYYDVFMRVMQEATIKNNSNISEIFTVSKAAFDQLLDNPQLLDYDFEQRLKNIYEKTKATDLINNSENNENKEENDQDDNLYKNNINGSNNSSNIHSNNVDDNQYDENDSNNDNQSNLCDEFNNSINCDCIIPKGAENNDSITNYNNQNKDDENKSESNSYNDFNNYSNENNNEIKSSFYDNSNNYEEKNNNNNINDEENGNDNIITTKKIDDNIYKNSQNKNDQYDVSDDENINEFKNQKFNMQGASNELNSNNYDENENNSKNSYENDGNQSNHLNLNIDEMNSDNLDDENNGKRSDTFSNNYDDDGNANDSCITRYNINENYNENSEAENAQNPRNSSDNDNNLDNNKNKRRVTFILPDNFQQKAKILTQNDDLNNFEEEDAYNNDNFSNFNFSNSGENDKNDVDEMTDEMILREAEKISSQKFNPKFKKFSSQERKVTTASKQSATVPNYQTILNALRFNSLPGPKYKKLYDSMVDLLKDYKDERILLLMASRTQKFKGIYILANDSASASKLWGNGPNEVKNEDISIYYKYINGQKSFDVIKSKSFTQTTDGFSLIKKLEPDKW